LEAGHVGVIIAALNYISQPFSAPAVCCRLPLSLSSITGQPTVTGRKTAFL